MAETPYLLPPGPRVIAVTCSDRRMFDEWVGALDIPCRGKFGYWATMGNLTWVCIRTEMDVQGYYFDGVVRLAEIHPAAEEALIEAMRPAIRR